MKFDARELAVFYNRGSASDRVRLPEDFDSSQWTQFALEIQPDGQTALFVNQEFLRTFTPPLIIEPGSRWKIQLAGASENTELLVRSVTLYSGTG